MTKHFVWSNKWPLPGNSRVNQTWDSEEKENKGDVYHFTELFDVEVDGLYFALL